MAWWNRSKKKKDESPEPDSSSEQNAQLTEQDAADVAESVDVASSSDIASLPESQMENESESEEHAPAEVSEVETSDVEPTTEEPKKKRGWFASFKSAVQKTAQVLNTDIRDLVKDGRLVDDEFLKELFAHLVKTDMGGGPASEIRDRIGRDFRARKVYMKDLVEAASETIRGIMEQPESPITFSESGPTVIFVCGVNGSGKTTSIAKLTNMFREQGKSVVLGAGDTFRAAAVEQLTIWAQRLGAEIVTGKQNGDPAAVAYQAADAAKQNNVDICIIDTAGRLQTQKNLMAELSKIRNVIKKVIPDAPHEVLLVLDATAGQNAISQARGFSEAAGCTGIILAKLDGTAKGGVAIPIRREFDLPVKYIGLGEKAEDIALFNVDKYVDALFEGIGE